MPLKNKNILKEREFYCLCEGVFFKIWLKLDNFFDQLRTLTCFQKWKLIKFKEIDFGTCEPSNFLCPLNGFFEVFLPEIRF